MKHEFYTTIHIKNSRIVLERWCITKDAADRLLWTYRMEDEVWESPPLSILWRLWLDRILTCFLKFMGRKS